MIYINFIKLPVQDPNGNGTATRRKIHMRVMCIPCHNSIICSLFRSHDNKNQFLNFFSMYYKQTFSYDEKKYIYFFIILENSFSNVRNQIK